MPAPTCSDSKQVKPHASQ